MNILIDTNVVLDLILERKEFYKDAKELFDLIADDEINAYISIKSLFDLYYILKGHYHNHNESLSKIVRVIDLLHILDMNDIDILKAIGESYRDFEDDVITQVGIRSKMDYIITRNKKDFNNNRIPILNRKEILEVYKRLFKI